MSKSLAPNFHQTEAILDPLTRNPDISDDIQQVLSRMMGWYDFDSVWKFIRTDENGRLLVASTASNASRVTLSNRTATGGVDNVLQANPARTRFEIIALTAMNITVGFDTGLTIATGITVPIETVYYDELYSGDVYIIAPLGGLLQVREWV